MIGDQKEAPRTQVVSNAPGRIGEQNRTAAESCQEPHAEDDALQRVAFVGVNATLQTGDLDAADPTQPQLTGMAAHRRSGEVRDLLVRHRARLLQRIGERAEPRPENDAEGRRRGRWPATLDRRKSLVDLALSRPGHGAPQLAWTLAGNVAMVRAPRNTAASDGAVTTGTPLMSSKFTQFLEKNKIDPRRVRAASRELERLRSEDRAAKLAKRRAKAGEAPAAAADGEKSAPKKPRSGRPITQRVIQAAVAGKPVPGPAKTRLVRAVNHILAQKKQEAVDLRAIF